MARPFPQAAVEEIVRLHRSGLSREEIAESMRVSAEAVRGILRRNGVDTSRRGSVTVTRDPRSGYKIGARFRIHELRIGMFPLDGATAWHNGMQFRVVPQNRRGEPYTASVIGLWLIRHDTGERLEPSRTGGKWVEIEEVGHERQINTTAAVAA